MTFKSIFHKSLNVFQFDCEITHEFVINYTTFKTRQNECLNNYDYEIKWYRICYRALLQTMFVCVFQWGHRLVALVIARHLYIEKLFQEFTTALVFHCFFVCPVTNQHLDFTAYQWTHFPSLSCSQTDPSLVYSC